MDGNTLAALVVGRAELDRDGGGWDGWKHGGAAGGEGSRETVRGAAGREIVDEMDGNTVAALLAGRAELDRDTVNSAAGRERGRWDGRKQAALVVGRAELDRDTVRGAAGRERG